MHRRADIFRAVESLRAAGFRNISMDLIAGLPHQTRESWESLRRANSCACCPEHVSIYMLEIDEGSRLGKESLAGGSATAPMRFRATTRMADFYESACARLAAAGYDHYEISNWGLPGQRSRHNLKYWRREPYLGFGAGAHSFDGTAALGQCPRSRPLRHLHRTGHVHARADRNVTPWNALEEQFFLGLRQLEGIDLARIEREIDPTLTTRLATLQQRIEMLRSHGLLDLEGGRLRIPPDRLTISNEVFLELLG